MTKTKSLNPKNLLLHPKEHSPAGKLNSALVSGQEYLVITEARASSQLDTNQQDTNCSFSTPAVENYHARRYLKQRLIDLKAFIQDRGSSCNLKFTGNAGVKETQEVPKGGHEKIQTREGHTNASLLPNTVRTENEGKSQLETLEIHQPIAMY